MNPTMATTILIAALIAIAAPHLTAAQPAECAGCLPNKCITLESGIASCFQCMEEYTLKQEENHGRVCISAPLMEAMGNEDGPDELAPETSPTVIHSSPTAAPAPATETSPAQPETQAEEATATEEAQSPPTTEAATTETPAASLPEPEPVPTATDSTSVSGATDEEAEPMAPPMAETPSEPETTAVTPGVDDGSEMTPDTGVDTSSVVIPPPASLLDAPESEVILELDSVGPVDEDPVIVIEFNE